MTNLEYLKKNFNKFNLYDEDLFCELAFTCKTGKRCDGFKYERCSEGCSGCQFKNIKNAIDYLLQEHKEPIKLTKFEYDLLMSYINKGYYFKNYSELKEMRSKGYFKGITDASMKIQDILKNCEVIE